MAKRTIPSPDKRDYRNVAEVNLAEIPTFREEDNPPKERLNVV
jgi:hypothetical protein